MLNSAPKNSTTVRSRNSVHFAKAALQTAYLLSEDLGTGLAERLFTSPRRHTRPERERDVLVSARASTVEVTLRSPRWNGEKVEVAVWRWGHGPAVLLVHGWEGRGSQLGAFVQPLLRAGLSVVAFDAPGHGDSPDHRLYLTDLADTIADVAAATGPIRGVIAHSFGAAGVLLAGVRNDFRVPYNVMIAPNVLIDDSVRRFARMVGLDDLDRIGLEQRIAVNAGVPVSALRLDKLVAERDERMLIVHDSDDREVPLDNATALADAWSDAQLVTTEGLGHRRILRDEDVIASAVELVATGYEPPVSDLVRMIDRQLEDL